MKDFMRFRSQTWNNDQVVFLPQYLPTSNWTPLQSNRQRWCCGGCFSCCGTEPLVAIPGKSIVKIYCTILDNHMRFLRRDSFSGWIHSTFRMTMPPVPVMLTASVTKLTYLLQAEWRTKTQIAVVQRLV